MFFYVEVVTWYQDVLNRNGWKIEKKFFFNCFWTFYNTLLSAFVSTEMINYTGSKSFYVLGSTESEEAQHNFVCLLIDDY